jgi:hypothetical protein
MPDIKDYRSTLAASRDVEIFKNTFPQEHFFVKESKESFEIFYFNMKSSNLIKLFKRHALKLPRYSCNSLHYINVRN